MNDVTTKHAAALKPLEPVFRKYGLDGRVTTDAFREEHVGVRAFLPNGIVLSIQRSASHYCNMRNGVDIEQGTDFEVAAWYDGDRRDRTWISLDPPYDNPIGWQTPAEIDGIIERLIAKGA